MPIITPVEAKSSKVKVVYFFVYLVLTLGAITMVYPLLLMIAGSVKTDSDTYHQEAIPRFLFDRTVQYRKYLESKYTGSLTQLQQGYRIDTMAWRFLEMPDREFDPRLVELFNKFSEEHARIDWQVPAHASGQLPYYNVRLFRTFLQKHFGDIDAANEALGGTSHESFLELNFIVDSNMQSRRYRPLETEYREIFIDYVMALPANERVFIDLDGFYIHSFVRPTYGTIENYNEAHGTDYGNVMELSLPERAPSDPALRKDWDQFVRNELNLGFFTVDESEAGNYRRFLQDKYEEIEILNERYHTQYADFSQVTFPGTLPKGDIQVTDWDMFIIEEVDLDAIEIYAMRQAFEDFLREHDYPFDSPQIMAEARVGADLADFEENRRKFLWRAAGQNYLYVLDYILLHGRGVYNTVVYVFLTIAAALIVNPMAAYALSRYKPPSSYKILLFCMATMAFPPAVAMIPSFLLLRNLGLLNTFAALILPGMANGFLIFLLKGFFDSLPQELFESAEIDGATEWTKFWVVAMSLSKPILAVIGLQAFIGAYSNFMFALIIIPDQRMWTLMVWLYKLQADTHQAVQYASLCLAAIPTLVVFVMAQKVIMRGIVIPVEK